MPTFITTLYAFIAANLPFFVQIAVLLASIGAFFGWLAGRFAGSKAANVFAIIAAYTIDVMKIVDEVISLFGGQPPMLGRRRTTKGPFDDVITPATPVIDLGKKPSPDSTKKVDVPRFRFAAPFAMVLVSVLCVLCTACPSLTPAAGPTADAVACASGYIVETGLEGVTPTISGFESQCASQIQGLASAALTTIFDLLVQAFAVPSSPGDAGLAKQTAPSPFLSGAVLMRNVYAAKAGVK